jgi:hypothetical protein
MLRHRAHVADGRTLPGARRRSGMYALAVLVLMLATGCTPTTRLTPAPTAIPTATTPPAPTSTRAPEDAFRDELEAITGLRGRDLARGPAFEVERLADVTIVHIIIQLSSLSLPDAQWDPTILLLPAGLRAALLYRRIPLLSAAASVHERAVSRGVAGLKCDYRSWSGTTVGAPASSAHVVHDALSAGWPVAASGSCSPNRDTARASTLHRPRLRIGEI